LSGNGLYNVKRLDYTPVHEGEYRAPGFENPVMEARPYDPNYLATLPYDIFEKLVIDNEITGRSLISLCSTDTRLYNKCNERGQKLFKQLLSRDHPDIDLTRVRNYRQAYVNTLGKLSIYTRIPRESFTIDDVGVSQVILLDQDLILYLTYGSTLKALELRHLGYGNLNDKMNTRTLAISFGSRIVQIAGNKNALLYLTEQGSVYYVIPQPYLEITFATDKDLKKVERIPPIKKIASKAGHHAMIDNEDRVWVFGSNEFGGLGIKPEGDLLFVESPIRLMGFKARDVQCGQNITAILDQHGRIWVLGAHITTTPEMIPYTQGITEMAVGESFIAFLDGDGRVWVYDIQIVYDSTIDDYKRAFILNMIKDIPKILKINASDRFICLFDENRSVQMYNLENHKLTLIAENVNVTDMTIISASIVAIIS
jgi:hypothetical protein